MKTYFVETFTVMNNVYVVLDFQDQPENVPLPLSRIHINRSFQPPAFHNDPITALTCTRGLQDKIRLKTKGGR